jgi:hypothetical protein
MNVCGHDIVPEHQGNTIDQVQQLGIIGGENIGQFMDPAFLDIEKGNCKVVGKGITADRGNRPHQNNA